MHKVCAFSAKNNEIGYGCCMSFAADHVSRPLSRRESQIVAWLEEERPPLVNARDLSQAFGLEHQTASDVLRRMANKGWMHRVAQGSYEPLLADSGGIGLPNPWATLAAWKAAYYVSYASGAFELNLTPDRPGTVQVCVPMGTSKPSRFSELPISLVYQRHFSMNGTALRTMRAVHVRMAETERVLIDSAIRPARVGGAIALGRITYRALDSADWQLVTALAIEHPRGRAGARRLAALIELLQRPVPRVLADFASQQLPGRPMLLDDATIYGWGGELVKRFGVVANVSPESLQEELRR